MINVLLHSGLLNATFWAAVLAFVLLLVSRRRGQKTACALDLSRSTLLIVILGFGAVAADGFGLYKGYVLPLDIMQDIVSARECLEGRSLYPADMSKRIQECLDREPAPLSLMFWSPALYEKEIEARREARNLHWVQAHPPFMTLFFTPFVMCLGVSGTYAAISLLSLVTLGWSLVLLQRGLELNLSRRQSLALALAILGWAPVANVLRTGQTGLLLGGLIIGGWYSLRRGRPVLAGVAIGVATCLKLFPGLLLVYLLLRHRRAFLSAALTTVGLLAFTGAVAGWEVYREYLETGRGVVAEYASFTNNLSLLGSLARTLGEVELGRAIFLTLAFVIVAGLAYLMSSRITRAKQTHESLDLEYALCVMLMPLLSPITWDHYLVVLLLPLAVLGRRALAENAHGAMAAWLTILVILAIPDTTYFWLSPIVEEHFGPFWNSTVLQSLRTIAMAASCLWLACLIRTGQKSVGQRVAREESLPPCSNRTANAIESMPLA
jgi:hypothetical protein